MVQPYFFTPPKLKPLGIDAAGLGGGGSYGEFFGMLADCREIYCRYRFGHLSVHLAKNPHEEVDTNEAPLLEEEIGPGFHGSLSVGQLCRYAGITINGVTPPQPDEAEIWKDGLLDLSGETTFLDLSVESSKATAIDFYNAIVDGSLELVGFDAAGRNGRNFELCERGEQAKGQRMYLGRRTGVGRAATSWPVETAQISGVGSFPIFGIVQHGAFAANFRPLIYSYSHTDRPQKGAVYLEQEGGFPVDHLWLRLSFLTADKTGRELARAVHRILLEKFPPTSIRAHNMETGERIPEKDLVYDLPLDPQIAAWLAASDDRWLRGGKSDGVFCGYRP